jgi:hypothetical protein
MTMNPLLTATALVQWADQRRSQDMLPLLIRRLILATVDPIRIDFASGDSVNRPGYDGFPRSSGAVPRFEHPGIFALVIWPLGCT